MFGLTSILDKALAALCGVLLVALVTVSGIAWWKDNRLTAAEAKVKVLNDTLTLQNAGIDMLKANSDKLDSMAKSMTDIAANARANVVMQASKIRKVPLTGQECTDLANIIDQARY